MIMCVSQQGQSRCDVWSHGLNLQNSTWIQIYHVIPAGYDDGKPHY